MDNIKDISIEQLATMAIEYNIELCEAEVIRADLCDIWNIHKDELIKRFESFTRIDRYPIACVVDSIKNKVHVFIASGSTHLLVRTIPIITFLKK